jgi:hypothetical protein
VALYDSTIYRPILPVDTLQLVNGGEDSLPTESDYVTLDDPATVRPSTPVKTLQLANGGEAGCLALKLDDARPSSVCDSEQNPDLSGRYTPLDFVLVCDDGGNLNDADILTLLDEMQTSGKGSLSPTTIAVNVVTDTDGMDESGLGQANID